ncbi:MAG: SRPBCC family protein [Gemmatimonadaceae bacterium]|nr:SRPBCC family protein [Gemmatimonadaceae bacterium]
MSINRTAQVSLPSDTEVRVTRDFKAPRTLVWQTHTDPALFQRWIGGYPGWSMPVCEMDVRVGGKYRWSWRSDEEGKEFGFFGDFREVDAPETLVSAEYFDPGSFGGEMPTSPTINRTTFSEKNGITTVVVLIQYASKEARDGAISTGMTDGMEVSYARLDTLVAEHQAG